MGFVSQLLKKSWADYSVNAVVSRLGEMSAFTSQTSSAHIKTSVLGCDQSLQMGVPLLELTNVCDKDFDPVFPYRRCCLPWGYKCSVCVWPGPWLIVMEGVPFTGGHKCSVCVWSRIMTQCSLRNKKLELLWTEKHRAPQPDISHMQLIPINLDQNCIMLTEQGLCTKRKPLCSAQVHHFSYLLREN